jgi:Rv2525c-like, glycoside hydrolase-like domain
VGFAVYARLVWWWWRGLWLWGWGCLVSALGWFGGGCRRLGWVVVMVLVFGAGWGLVGVVSAWAGVGAKVVRYRGYRVVVPVGWLVFDLAADPGVCVRFDRHAVYLGRPGSEQRCPAHSVGRTEAILIEPGGGARVASAGSSVGVWGSEGGLPFAARLRGSRGVVVVATWRAHPAVVERALGVRGLAAAGVGGASASAGAGAGAGAGAVAVAARAGGADPVYTGLGFDPCATPSVAQMAAWRSSPYHAVGVYLGGANMACSQPNLTAGWVAGETAAGWHLIPTYVGLQAPGNSCGCLAIDPGRASAQGAAAASDAVGNARAVRIGAGSPIYFDMEAYSPGAVATSAVLSFLAGWTARLHADGYKSGVYSSLDSGVSDLVARYGTGYTEPDEIWFADWNGEQTTSSPFIPAGDWSEHQRLHQYSGGVDATYGGVTLNIDGDYLDGATVGAGTAAGAATDPPVELAPPSISGRPDQGQTLLEAHGTWSNDPTSFGYRWEDCNSAGGGCAAIPSATAQRYALRASDMGHTLRVQETARNAAGSGGPATSAATGPVRGGSYWLYTVFGNVYGSPGAAWYGSPFASHINTTAIVGMASTPDGHGYWLAGWGGRVFAYGDAAALPTTTHSHPVKGIVTDPNGGYWLYTAYGNVYSSPGTPWYGSPLASHINTTTITGMTTTPDGHGYWLTDSTGNAYPNGDAAAYPIPPHTHPIKGITH